MVLDVTQTMPFVVPLAEMLGVAPGYPKAIGRDIAMRRPGRVNNVVQQKEGGAFLVLLWIKRESCTVPFGTCPRIRRLDFHRPAELFGPGSKIERV